jgi:aminoglycoside 6-adenylyltransferase
VIGSRARQDHPADEWSDLDMIVFADDFGPYLANADWLNTFGEVWVWVRDWIGTPASDAPCPEYLVVYEGGRKLDFAFFPVDELRRLVDGQLLENVYRKGYRALVDKDGLAARLIPAPSTLPPAEQPSPEAFETLNRQFWYAALQEARALRRGDLWGTRLRDHAVKDHLLTMIEWHARARYGLDRDTWHSGRFMREWADPPVWEALYVAFGHFDADDSARALHATLVLFRRLSNETAQQWGYAYPARLDERITGLINSITASAERLP